MLQPPPHTRAMDHHHLHLLLLSSSSLPSSSSFFFFLIFYFFFFSFLFFIFLLFFFCALPPPPPHPLFPLTPLRCLTLAAGLTLRTPGCSCPHSPGRAVTAVALATSRGLSPSLCQDSVFATGSPNPSFNSPQSTVRLRPCSPPAPQFPPLERPQNDQQEAEQINNPRHVPPATLKGETPPTAVTNGFVWLTRGTANTQRAVAASTPEW